MSTPQQASQQPPAQAPQRPAPVLGRPRWSGSTAAAIVHGVIGLTAGVILLREPPGGYTYAVYDGPRDVAAFLPGDPLAAWGVLLVVPAVGILVGQGRPWTKWPLLVLAAALAGFSVPAWIVGATSTQAASLLGVLGMGLSVLALHAALALGRR